MAIARAEVVWKTFDSRDVVRDVSFTVEAGEVLGMVGLNGAGKTTTIRMLLDIIKPDRGEVLLFDQPFAKEHRALLGYLPEERGLYRASASARRSSTWVPSRASAAAKSASGPRSRWSVWVCLSTGTSGSRSLAAVWDSSSKWPAP